MSGKFIRFATLLLAVMLMLNGCSMIAVDKEKDAQEIVAEFTGGSITKAEAMDEYERALAMYESYGYDIKSDEATVKEIKQTILDYLAESKVVRSKADEMGLTALSEEEKQTLIDQATEEYNNMLEYYKIYFEGETEEETEKATVEYLESNGYSLESAQEYMLDAAWQDKLQAEVTKDVQVTDEQIQTAYDEKVAADQESYSADAYSFEYAMATGSTSSWYPEGYRTVKHILIPYTAEQTEALDALRFELDEINYEIEWRAEQAATEEEDDTQFTEEGDALPGEEFIEEGDAAADAEGEMLIESDGEAEEPQPTAASETQAQPAAEPADEPQPEVVDEPDDGAEEALDDSLDVAVEPADTPDEPALEADTVVDESGVSDMTDEELAARKAELEAQIASLQNEYAAALQPTIDEVMAKIQAGEDFNALIEQYGEDDGMKEEPVKTTGYYIAANSEMFDAAFTQAAMALAKVGDVSQPVAASAGIHIIRYESDVTPGAVPLEQVREAVAETALETAKAEAYDAKVAEWVAAANVKTYIDRMN